VRAAIYVRISRDISGESLGVTRQLEDCREVAEKAGWAVAEVYVDNDISATSGKPRPGYRKMLDDIKGGQLDAIVAWHSDRLYRRVVDLVELVDIVKEYDLQIATARSGEVDLTTPTGRLIAGMLAQIATYEGEAKSDRWKRSIRQRRETGEVHTMGPRLYGYERDGTIVPHEREHLEWAAGQILDGAALVRTTIGLNERGSRTTLGNEWNRAGLKKTLTNPRLAGMSVLNGDVVGVGQWQPIFDAETFEALQAAFAVRKGTVPRRPRVALLLGLAKCGKCGEMLRSGRRYRSEGENTRTYRCATLPGTKQGCGGIVIAAEPVEEIVEAYAQERAKDPRVQAYIDELSARSGQHASEALALETRIRELEDQLSEPGVPVTAIVRAIDRSKERLETLRAAGVEPMPHLAAGIDWPTDLARRARAVRNVVAEVVIEPAASNAGVFDPERVKIVSR
jgi:site-specific DNA recombinase